jgi:hypothetical protein
MEETMDCLLKRTREALATARGVYGYNNQLLVAIEELNELSCVLAKYPRYETHTEALASLKSKVIDECGDVLNALDHIQAIFDISDEEMVEAAAKKGDRLRKWLYSSNSLEVTTYDRGIPENPCPMCASNGSDPFSMPCLICKTKPGYKGFSAKKSI